MEQPKKTLSTLIRVGLFVVLAVYAFVLVKIILLKYGLNAGLRSVNSVPFLFVNDLLHPTTSLGVGLKNVLGNFAIFIPLGLITPALSQRFDRFWKPVLLGLGVSALFELLQFVFGLGATDVDDLILNTLGAMAGSGLYVCVCKRFLPSWKAAAVTLVMLAVFGAAGVLALWLYAPNELPRIVEHKNVEALGGLDRDAYDLSVTLTGMDAHTLLCRAGSAYPNGDAEPAAAQQSEYPLADGAKFYLETISAKYSPNGNIQKTICTYSALDAPDAAALFTQAETVFADLWLDADGACNTLLLTQYEDEKEG